MALQAESELDAAIERGGAHVAGQGLEAFERCVTAYNDAKGHIRHALNTAAGTYRSSSLFNSSFIAVHFQFVHMSLFERGQGSSTASKHIYCFTFIPERYPSPFDETHGAEASSSLMSCKMYEDCLKPRVNGFA